MEKEILLYASVNGAVPVEKWLAKRDVVTRQIIHNRIIRLAHGNWGDYKKLRGPIIELRIDYGPGYRLYCAELHKKWVLLLCGGDKKTQKKDIETATLLYEDYDARTKESL